MKKITVLGGGTGSYVVLSGLKKYPLDLAVIVTMMDSGGSTGRLRDQLGVLPPGDLRRCLVALSEAPILWRKLFLYRFESGDLKGHNFGNIFLSALEKVSTNYQEAIDTVSYVLKVKGAVIPVTYTQTHICAIYENGVFLKGEKFIDEHIQRNSKIKNVYLEPQAVPNSRAIERINDSDYLIIGPGDIYSSIVPIFLVTGIKQAIKKSKAKIIYNLNLMTNSGQTADYRASDHLADLEKYLGRKVDFVIVNNGPIQSYILKWYLTHHEKPVEVDLHKNGFNIVAADLVDNREIIKNQSDELYRSVLRHDSEKLAKVLYKIIQ